MAIDRVNVMWLTNALLPAHAARLGEGPNPRGGWMGSLAEVLWRRDDVRLTVVADRRGRMGRWRADRIDGVTYYVVERSFDPRRHVGLPRRLLAAYDEVFDRVRPDVVHVHGTEYFHGLVPVRAGWPCPVVVSVQGLLEACRAVWDGGLSPAERRSCWSLRDWVRVDGLSRQQERLDRRVLQERAIFRAHRWFMGRTDWDREQIERLCPGAAYLHCDEVLRPPFYRGAWTLEGSTPQTLLTSGSAAPLKGLGVLLRALAEIRGRFDRLRLRVIGGGFDSRAPAVRRLWWRLRRRGTGAYLTALTARLGLQDCVEVLGTVDAETVAAELRGARLFVLPSLMENSSNSLSEAMRVGTPSVACWTGGLPTLTDGGRAAVLVPPGDARALAVQIERLLQDDSLAEELSRRARRLACRRHDPERIARQTVSAYRYVIWRSPRPASLDTSRMSHG